MLLLPMGACAIFSRKQRITKEELVKQVGESPHAIITRHLHGEGTALVWYSAESAKRNAQQVLALNKRATAFVQAFPSSRTKKIYGTAVITNVREIPYPGGEIDDFVRNALENGFKEHQ